VEGPERYPVNLRYMRDYRQSLDSLRRVLIPTPTGTQVPLGELASIRMHQGPPAIKTEAARKNAWIYVDLNTSDVGGYVAEARRIVEERVHVPEKYNIVWSGQYEYMEAARKRLSVAIPLTLVVIILILYFNTRSALKTGIVLLAVPFSLIGSFWLLWALGYNMSVAVWVGLIALAGLDAETGVVMLLYLEVAHGLYARLGRMKTYGDLMQAIDHGAVKRIRPKMMTVCAIIAGLLPILWGTGTGSDVMKRIAAPMVGGVITSLLMELAVYPVVFFYLKRKGLDPSMVPSAEGVVHESHGHGTEAPA